MSSTTMVAAYTLPFSLARRGVLGRNAQVDAGYFGGPGAEETTGRIHSEAEPEIEGIEGAIR